VESCVAEKPQFRLRMMCSVGRSMKVSLLTARLPLAVATWCLVASAGYSQSAFVPSAGDPEVFYRYLRQTHQAVSETPQPVSSPAQQGAAAMMHVTAGDLAVLENVYQDTTNAIAALDTEAKTYINETVKAKSTPDLKKLQDYYARRVQILEAADQQLRNLLGDASWRRTREYIDGDFRSHVKRRVYQWKGQQ